MPKELRKYIYVNESTAPLVSLDFSGMHPRLAYHLEMVPYGDDPYIIDGYGKEYRDWFKVVALVALNAKSRDSAIRAIADKLRERNIADLKYGEVKILLKAFEDHHQKISKYICSDFGIKAMYYDALIIEDCLRELMIIKKGIVLLPIHDELLCPPDKVKIVKEQMILSYRKVLRRALIDNGKLGKNDLIPDDLQPVL